MSDDPPRRRLEQLAADFADAPTTVFTVGGTPLPPASPPAVPPAAAQADGLRATLLELARWHGVPASDSAPDVLRALVSKLAHERDEARTDAGRARGGDEDRLTRENQRLAQAKHAASDHAAAVEADLRRAEQERDHARAEAIRWRDTLAAEVVRADRAEEERDEARKFIAARGGPDTWVAGIGCYTAPAKPAERSAPSLVHPQPAPTPGGAAVWPVAIAWARREGASPELLDLMAQRDAFGREKHGTPLAMDNGRDALVDALQEALDCVAYLTQAQLEGPPDLGLDGDRREAWRLAERIRGRIAARGDR